MSQITLTAQEYKSKYQSLRKKINFPFKIQLYFSLLQSALNGTLTKNIQYSQSFSPLFLTNFSKMSQLEKSYFLFSNVQFMKRQQQRIEENSNDSMNRAEHIKKNISVGGQMSETIMGLTYWKTIQFSFMAEKKQVKIDGKKDTIILDLRLYLVRKSQKYKDTLVFQATQEQVPSQQKKLSFFLKGYSFNEVYNELFKSVLDYRNQQILKMVMEEMGMNQNNMEVSLISKNHKALMFLNSKNVNDFINYKDTVLKKILTSNFGFKSIYKIDNCMIERSQKHSNYYKLQSIFEYPAQILKEEFFQKYKEQNFAYLMQSQILQTFSHKYSAIYSKHVFSQTQTQGSKIMEHIFIQQKSNKSLDEVLFLKGVDNVMMKKSIQFILVKIKQITSDKSKLIIIGCFTKGSKSKKKTLTKLNNETRIMFLTQFSEMLFRKDEIEHLSNLLVGRQINQNYEQSGEFRTVQGKFQKTLYKEEQVQDFEDGYSENFTQGNESENYSVDISIKFQSNSPKSKVNRKMYLSHHYLISPVEPVLKKQVLSQHFLFTEWNRKFTGGIVCKDNNHINEQKKVFKHILTTMGKNVIHNRGLLNVSLPVNVFKAESHLQSIAKNFGFAPLLLERTVNMSNLQKMKYSILFAISVSTLSICISKPFNPILGETLQVWIDGCPMYLQQISHHPPVTSYYFVGRGYKIYGQIGTKANFGFNTIYGYSDKPNFILFDDGTQIQINFAKMAIKGLLFGQREFHFTEKMYAFDSKNRLFSSLSFGDQSKSLFNNNPEPIDYFEGQISYISQQFKDQYGKSPSVIYPSKKQILKEISFFEGIWSGRIFFDEQEYIDFGRQNPCVLKDEECPLPSNSTYREDILHLQEGNLQLSQNAKELLEEKQRRDRKLRLSYKKK